MLYSVMLFGTLTIVKAVKRSYKVTCDTANSVKGNIV